jgi:uncharacterized membrane protein
MSDPNKYASPEQLRYARVLSIGVILGFVLLVVSFFLYVTGILPPLVPIAEIPKYWSLPADQFVKVTHSPTGWSWITEIGKGDILNLVGVAVLASISIVSTLAVLPIFARNRERMQIVISLVLVAVLIFAASNVLARFH